MTELDIPTLVDLRQWRREQWHATWSRTVPALFPGLRLKRWLQAPSVGRVQQAALGSSAAWLISSSAVEVHYWPPEQAQGPDVLSLMLQLEGATAVRQRARRCLLAPGDICLLDNNSPFLLSVAGASSKFIALQIPRERVLRHYPGLADACASRFAANDPVPRLLGQHLLQTLRASARLREAQQEIALDSLIQLLGLLDLAELPEPDSPAPARQARQLIQSQLADPELDAFSLARRLQISRRQLDRLCRESYGLTATGLIRDQRLARCAHMLREPAYRERTVTEIALACGFGDSAHFSRAFKQQYRLTPTQWRRRGKGDDPEQH